MQQLACVDRATKPIVYQPLHGFTAVDLGYESGDAISNFVTKIDTAPHTESYLALFNQIWNDPERVADITERLSEHIAAVYKENSPTPLNVRRVLERCLVRDRYLRYRDIGDVRVELLQAGDGGLQESTASRSLPVWLVPVVGLALLAVAAGVWFGKPVPESSPPAVVQADIALPDDLLLAHPTPLVGYGARRPIPDGASRIR